MRCPLFEGRFNKLMLVFLVVFAFIQALFDIFKFHVQLDIKFVLHFQSFWSCFMTQRNFEDEYHENHRWNCKCIENVQGSYQNLCPWCVKIFDGCQMLLFTVRYEICCWSAVFIDVVLYEILYPFLLKKEIFNFLHFLMNRNIAAEEKDFFYKFCRLARLANTCSSIFIPGKRRKRRFYA
jgi:hypothetical protein